MKPAPFRYLAPHSVEEALLYLAEHGYDAKVLAGGQSLVPAMNFRLAQPALLVDLNRVPELFYVNEMADGTVHLGAMTRQRTVEQSAAIARRVPLLHATMPHIAHVQIRNRGTVGGSLAHADPAAELPAVMVALGAQFRLRNLQGERMVAAGDFYIGLFTTDLQPDEILAEIVVPPPPPRTGWAFQEIARRHGDYALVGAAATVTLAADGRCAAARLIYFSVGDGPTMAHAAQQALAGQQPDAAAIAEAARLAAQVDIEPLGDIHATPAFRRHLIEVLGRRTLTEAALRAAA